MTSAFGSFDRSPLGGFIRSPLGARGLVSDTGLTFALVIVGEFTGGAAYYDADTDDWISLGLGIDGQAAVIFDSQLYVATASDVYKYLGNNQWIACSGVTFGPNYFIEHEGILYSGGGDGVMQFSPSTLTWSALGTSSHGNVAADGNGLWSGNDFWNGVTWVTKSGAQYGAGAGSPTFRFIPTTNDGRYFLQLHYSSNAYDGFYVFDSINGEWNFSDNQFPNVHNKDPGAVDVSSADWIWTGGIEISPQFLPGGWDLATEISDVIGDAAPTSGHVRLLFVDGEPLLLSSGELYKGTKPIEQTTPPLTAANWMELIEDEIYIVGNHASTGRVLVYDVSGDSYAVKGSDLNNPDDAVHQILGGYLETLAAIPESTAHLHLADTVSVSLAGSLTITGCSPGSGSSGQPCTISGTNFTGSTTVLFGATTADNITFISSTQILCQAPAGESGTVDVTVSDGGDSDVLSNGFTYT